MVLSTVLAAVPDRPADAEPDADARGPVIAPALARVIIAVVFCGFGTVALLYVVQDGKGAGGIVLAGTCLLALLALQYFYFCRPSTDLRSREAYAALALQACLVYLPVLVLGQGWVSQPSFLAGSVLMVLGPRARWVAYAAVVMSTGVEQYFVSGQLFDIVYILVNTPTSGLFVFGLTRLARLVTALHAARNELATRAVAGERVRFARDLHALLGASLSAIAPRGELTLRLLRRDPEQAGPELLEILRIARRALADLRSTARLYRENLLGDETASLTAMLAASNVVLRVDLDSRELPRPVRGRLAAVLREGIAAVLRQPEVTHCEIVLRQQAESVGVDILINGGGADRFGELAATVTAMAGRLATETVPDGRLRLRVTVPLTIRTPTRSSDTTDEPGESVPLEATKLSTGLVVAVLCGSFVQAVLRMVEVTPELGDLVLGAACLLAILGLQLGYFSRPGVRLSAPRSYLLLGLQAVFVYLPWLFGDQVWTGLPGFLAGSALLVLRPAWGWTAFGAVLASVAWFHLTGAGPRQDVFYILVTLDLGLITYGLTWMVRSVRQLVVARQELAEAALAEARLRFAQDLHDLLGLSLSAITLKSDLAYRQIVRDPGRAGVVVTEMVEIARHALVDVRSVSSGFSEMSLAEECRTAQELLAAAGLDVRMDLDHGELLPEVGTALATVLRECVTNVLRHSKGERCEITIRTDELGVHLQVANDGVTAPAETDHPGSGIRNMADRVGTLGGVLTAGYEGADRFVLRASIPASAASPVIRA